MIELLEIESKQDYNLAAELFKEYVSQLGIDLSFQNFNKELENIAIEYGRPEGTIFIAYNNKEPVGCFGVRKLDDSMCELKRMYVRESARGLGVGKQLLDKSIEVGKLLGYSKMRLDTLDTMHAAMSLYRKAGFYEIEPYRFNPLQGARYFEIDLDATITIQ